MGIKCACFSSATFRETYILSESVSKAGATAASELESAEPLGRTSMAKVTGKHGSSEETSLSFSEPQAEEGSRGCKVIGRNEAVVSRTLD